MFQTNLLPFFLRKPLPTTWPGLAINYNYNGSGANPAADLAYLRQLGFRRVRLLIVTYNDNNEITAWRAITQTALKLGFTEVIYGVSAGGNKLTSTTYQNFFTVVEQEATWAQGLNNPALTFCMGNEESQHVDNTTLTGHQMNANLITESARVKAIYTVGKVILSLTDDGTVSDFYNNTGSLDKIAVNHYDTDSNFNSRTALYLSHFGSMMYVTEWSSNGGFNDFNNEAQFAVDLLLRMSYLVKNGFGENNPCYLYNFMDGANKFGMKNTTSGAFRIAWQRLLASI